MKYLKQYKKLHTDWSGLHDRVRKHEYKTFLKYVKNFNSVLEIGREIDG